MERVMTERVYQLSQKWKYRTLVINPGEFDKLLNQMGEEEWELVSILEQALSYTCIFKKPIAPKMNWTGPR